MQRPTNEPWLHNKRGHPDLLYWVFSHRRKYLYMYYLCKLLTYCHQIWTVDACDVCVCAPTDTFTSGLTTLQGNREQNVKIKFSVNQGGIDRNRYTQRFVISHPQTY